MLLRNSRNLNASNAWKDKKSAYNTADFWEHQYAETTHYKEFEWYCNPKDYQEILVSLLENTRLLNLGCGTSEMPLELVKSSKNLEISSIDISKSCIQQCLEMVEKRGIPLELQKKMQWKVMDVTKLEYPAEYFDVVLDKATSDAILATRPGDTKAKLEAEKAVGQMFDQVFRVLKPKGIFLIMSKEGPRQYLQLFENRQVYFFTIPSKRLESGKIHCFVLSKSKESPLLERLGEIVHLDELSQQDYYSDEDSDESFEG